MQNWLDALAELQRSGGSMILRNVGAAILTKGASDDVEFQDGTSAGHTCTLTVRRR